MASCPRRTGGEGEQKPLSLSACCGRQHTRLLSSGVGARGSFSHRVVLSGQASPAPRMTAEPPGLWGDCSVGARLRVCPGSPLGAASHVPHVNSCKGRSVTSVLILRFTPVETEAQGFR